MFISQVLYLNHIVLHGLEVLLPVHPVYAQQILLSEINNIKDSNGANETNNAVTIYFCVPYYGNKGCSLSKSCIRKIKTKKKKEQSITFRVSYDVTKMDFFCSTKDKTPTLN